MEVNDTPSPIIELELPEAASVEPGAPPVPPPPIVTV
jgi:hypothetical protein